MEFFLYHNHPPRPKSSFINNLSTTITFIYCITILSSFILFTSICSTASPLIEVSNGRQQDLKPILNPSNKLSQDSSNGQNLQQSSFIRRPHQPGNQADFVNRPSSSLTLNANQAKRENFPNNNQANKLNYASLQNINFNATGQLASSDISDSMIVESGSGNGPIAVSKHSSGKFDDTEGGDDDDNDDGDNDDYDYKETGSGHGNDLSSSNKTDALVINDTKSEMKKPSLNESDYYRPFRQPPSPTANFTVAPYTAGTPKKFVESSTESPKMMVFSNVLGKAPQPEYYKPSNSSANKTFSNIENKANSKAFTQTTLLSQNSSSNVQETTLKSKPLDTITASATIPLNSNDNQVRVPNTTLPRPTDIVTTKFPNYNPNNSSYPILKPNASKIDVDYDYGDDDDNDDDDSDDVSNFEDNDLTENSMNNRTFVSRPPVISNVASRPLTTMRPTTLSTLPVTSTSKAVISTKPPVIFSSITQPSPTMKSSTPKESFVTTIRPSDSSPTSFINGANNENNEDEEEKEEEEEEEDDEEEEEENEDVIEGDPEDESGDTKGSESIGTMGTNYTPSLLPPIFSSPSSRWTTLAPQLTSMNTINDVERNQPKTTVPPVIKPSSSPRPSSFDIQILDHQEVTVAPAITNSVVTRTSVTFQPVTSPTLTSLATFIPTIAHTTPVPKLTQTTVRSVSINYMTTPWNRVTPIRATPPSILEYDKSLQEDDISLTKQIYDKAVEVYKVASKAIHTTVETVWPSSLELNANTFEPLMAQPLLFMLVLGAAVMGLVLTIMLVVYLITYQIDSKDDISLY